MPTARTRQRIPAAERRALLVDAAVSVFAERGYSGASLDEITGRAGVTKPLLYRHFASKADLYKEVVRVEMDRLLGGLEQATEPGASLELRVRAYVDAFFAYVEEHPFARRLLFRPPEAEAAVARAHDRAQERATQGCLALLAADESLLAGDPNRDVALEIYGQALKTALNGMAAWWLSHPEVPRADLVDRTIDLVWVGLRELRQADG